VSERQPPSGGFMIIKIMITIKIITRDIKIVSGTQKRRIEMTSFDTKKEA
jgi:hypothetical protein